MSWLLLCKLAAVGLVSLAVLAVTWRLWRGPSSADRVIATDMLGLLAICVAALVAGITGYQAFLDVAFGIALFGFLAAVAFGAMLERVSTRREPAE
jgi:multicomponent Na+:H+ antiporter subunit F